jgi:translation initiation factor 3 subunit J
MADAWDDSDDDWEKDDDELDARLKKVGIGGSAGAAAPPVFDDEEDLALKEKEVKEKQVHQELKKKGNALLERKMAEQERLIEIEVARKAMELEAELEATLSPDELRKLKQQQIEEADHVLTDDLFGGVDNQNKAGAAAAAGSDKLVLKDLKDHLKHAKTVGAVIKVRGNCQGRTIGCRSQGSHANIFMS